MTFVKMFKNMILSLKKHFRKTKNKKDEKAMPYRNLNLCYKILDLVPNFIIFLHSSIKTKDFDVDI